MPKSIRHWTNLELRQYLKILKKNIFFISLFILGGAVLAFMFTFRWGSGVRFEEYFYISTPRTADSIYYSQETARNFTDTAVAILASPDFVSGIILPNEQIAVRKIAPQVIKLTATAFHQETAKSVVERTVSGFNQKVADLAGDQAVWLSPVGQGGQTYPLTPNRSLIVIFGALAGSVFALFVIGLKTYFKV